MVSLAHESTLQCHNLTGRAANFLLLHLAALCPPRSLAVLFGTNPLLRSVKQTNAVTPITANAADTRLHLWPPNEIGICAWRFQTGSYSNDHSLDSDLDLTIYGGGGQACLAKGQCPSEDGC